MSQNYTDTNISNMILNDMTEAQFSNLQSVDPDQLYLTEDVSANQDLSNLSSTGQKVLDGQWVSIDSNNQIADTVTWNNTVSEAVYDISSYLPNDNYNYEVLITCFVQTAATANKFVTVQLSSDIFTTVYGIGTRASAAVSATANSNAIIPVGTGRTITQYATTSSNADGTYSLWIKGYRRIGTNS